MGFRRVLFRSVAPDGTTSITGHTRTLPTGPTRAFTIALFSCSNLPFGWFNAYAHAAARNDIDLVAHVGDYLYEYQVGNYPSLKDALPGRDIQPTHERSEEHTSELQSLMRISYAVFCLKKKTQTILAKTQ